MDRLPLGQHGADGKADGADERHDDARQFGLLAAMPLPPMIEASPAKAMMSASVRNRVGRSPSTGQAIREAQTGMV